MNGCAFIGYPPEDFFFKYNELHPLCQKIKDALLEQAKAQYQCGARRFYIGGGLGTDMWAGEAVLSLMDSPEYPGIELACVMPYNGYNNDWDDDSTARHEKLLSACADAQTAGKPNDRGSYKKRYISIIDQSQTIIAVCRVGRDKHSDAEAALEYAKKKMREIIIIHPETAEVTVYNP